jgi:DNA-binding response OmpR family regulator
LADGNADLARGVVSRSAVPVRLTTLEVDLHRYLAARPGQSIDRDESLREVWDYPPDINTRAVDNTVS